MAFLGGMINAALAITFGLWQNNLWAGVFMFFVGTLILVFLAYLNTVADVLNKKGN